jgi:DNA-binding LytR/AlgR family response regulator
MIRIAVCEDENAQLNLIEEQLIDLFKERDEKYKILKFKSGEELLENFPEKVDIFLLDIQMYKTSGMDVARSIRARENKSSEIIFITSLVDYMQEGYEVRAYRYLLKPIKYEDLKKHISSCIKEVYEKNKYLLIKIKGDAFKLKLSEITHIEVRREYVTINTVSNTYEIKSAMNNIEKDINSNSFYRCHKSFLVNLEYIESIKQYVAILENKVEVPISRYKVKSTKQRLFDLIGDKL